MTTPSLRVDGRVVPLVCEARTSLADHLRDCGATSVHLGCEHGACGACNVLLDGRSVRSCLTLAGSCEGSTITTLEGLDDPLAERLRAAFTTHHALQCGFCTPGMFVSAYELLAGGRPIDEATVRDRLAGNLCRCTGYQGIVDAVLDVAGVLERRAS